MRWSKYNIFFFSEKNDCYLLYNTLYNSFINISKHLYKEIMKLKANPNLLDRKNKIHNVLIDQKFFLEKENDCIKNNKLRILSNRFDSRVLTLTIAPTRYCNFNCVYCFEEFRPKEFMDKGTEDSVFEFVKRQKGVNKIKIAWYGGEPLLAKGTIIRLTHNILKLGINYSAVLITNGYLLDKDFINKIDSLRITAIQITLDGKKETHNKRRPHQIFNNSFDKILENIRKLCAVCKFLHISVRVNIDKTNKEEFIEVYNLIKKINRNIYVYPAFVHDRTGSCMAPDCFNNSEEKVEFLVDLFNKNGFYSEELCPQIKSNSCMMRQSNNYLIGPEGNLYKCWHHLGIQNKIVGNINKNLLYSDRLAGLMLDNDYLEKSICLKCKFFPICDGGCPDLNNENSNVDEGCSIYKKNARKLLELRYSHKKKMKNDKNKILCSTPSSK